MADRATRKIQITTRRREQIIQAAMEVFTPKGFDAATVPEIARQAGVAPGTIYLYFHNKRELFAAVIESLLVTPLVNMIEKESGNRFTSALGNAVADRLRVFQSGFMTRFLPLMGEIHRDPELKRLFKEKLIGPFLKRMESFYLSRIEAGELRKMDPQIMVRLVGGTVIGLNILNSIEEPKGPLTEMPQEKLVQEIIEFVLLGILDRTNPKTQEDSDERRGH